MKKGQSIYDFQIGDTITRLEKAPISAVKYNENLDIEVAVTMYQDGSYRGEPFEYLGIVNNMIIVKHLEGHFKDQNSSFELENWSEGWGYYETIDRKIRIKINNN